jgi:cell wall-associated NlpC family hydrolase
MAGRQRSIPFFCPAILAVLAVSGCSWQQPYPQGRVSDARGHYVPSVVADGRTVNERAAIVALRQLGTPYRYGGMSPKGFDCSGLVVYAYRKAGVDLPRTTGGLWKTLRPVRKKELRTGDLLFFNIDGKVSHVGMYLGSGRFVHAPATGSQVSVANLEDRFYQRAFVAGGRP